MRNVLDECRDTIITTEMCIVHREFKQWLAYKRIVPRTTVNVLEAELNEFELRLTSFYIPEDVTGLILDSDTMKRHVNNMTLHVLNEGAVNYCTHVRNTLKEMTNSRVSLNKLLKTLDAYVEDIVSQQISKQSRI